VRSLDLPSTAELSQRSLTEPAGSNYLTFLPTLRRCSQRPQSRICG
jgi:hypothetical protein